MRQIILDTETTGIDPKQGHRIIEIGCVELVERKLTNQHYHQYIRPEREIEQEAIEVHGITNEFLQDKPVFADVVEAFMAFVSGAELIIHNAPFDVGFINHELSQLPKNPWGKLEDHCKITDSLKMARKTYPGQRNSLDALCKRLGVDNSGRTLHGALLDSEILADVYLMMTGGQVKLSLSTDNTEKKDRISKSNLTNRKPIRIIHANQHEINEHHNYLNQLLKNQENPNIW
ncbi:DNA polymerase III subunit epsilon [Thiomicrospira microaerophila]|uniref:DNA polymerase III subunit epsilon n=1 Tax=Thiomicrospira microaerophila TaxID=406020 RepID=UPI00200D224D|nr:DNA polymerase III subunit epsilon [Thiomicrospira microaerophila]UQB41257.1 DNA polymerase III subunit epsilon [Thiomicrospira microaerophila]